MWHLELPEMKGEVVVVALVTFPILEKMFQRRANREVQTVN